MDVEDVIFLRKSRESGLSHHSEARRHDWQDQHSSRKIEHADYYKANTEPNFGTERAQHNRKPLGEWADKPHSSWDDRKNNRDESKYSKSGEFSDRYKNSFDSKYSYEDRRDQRFARVEQSENFKFSSERIINNQGFEHRTKDWPRRMSRDDDRPGSRGSDQRRSPERSYQDDRHSLRHGSSDSHGKKLHRFIEDHQGQRSQHGSGESRGQSSHRHSEDRHSQRSRHGSSDSRGQSSQRQSEDRHSQRSRHGSGESLSQGQSSHRLSEDRHESGSRHGSDDRYGHSLHIKDNSLRRGDNDGPAKIR